MRWRQTLRPFINARDLALCCNLTLAERFEQHDSVIKAQRESADLSICGRKLCVQVLAQEHHHAHKRLELL